MENSPRYQLNQADILHALKVLAYSLTSALVGYLIVLVGQFDVPAQWLFVVPIVNAGLVALQKYLTGRNGAIGFAKDV